LTPIEVLIARVTRAREFERYAEVLLEAPDSERRDICFGSGQSVCADWAA
jgi:hypothetical protein